MHGESCHLNDGYTAEAAGRPIHTTRSLPTFAVTGRSGSYEAISCRLGYFKAERQLSPLEAARIRPMAAVRWAFSGYALQRLQALRAPARVAAHHPERYPSTAPSARSVPSEYLENMKLNFRFLDSIVV